MGENAVHPMIVVMVAEDAVELEFVWRKKDLGYLHYLDSHLWIFGTIEREICKSIAKHTLILLTGSAWNNRHART